MTSFQVYLLGVNASAEYVCLHSAYWSCVPNSKSSLELGLLEQKLIQAYIVCYAAAVRAEDSLTGCVQI